MESRKTLSNIVLFLFISFQFCQAQESTTSKPYENCKIPKKVVDFEWNNTGVEPEGLYLPLGAKSDYHIIKEMLFGTSFNPDEDLVKLCARMRWNNTDVYINNNQNSTVHFNCDMVGGKSWIMECKQTEAQPDGKNYNHKAYITLTDKKTFAFIVRCWENGSQGWGVFSTKKTLQGDTEIHVLEHARALGYETAEALPLGYKKCGPTFTKTKS